jgi:hypothetical protein
MKRQKPSKAAPQTTSKTLAPRNLTFPHFRKMIAASIASAFFLAGEPAAALPSSIETLDTRIVAIDDSSAHGPVLVFLSAGGRVLRLSGTNDFLDRLRDAHARERSIRLKFMDVGDEDELFEVELYTATEVNTEDFEVPSALTPYQTGVTEPEVPVGRGVVAKELYDYFGSMGLPLESQCFHRAYLWAFEAWKHKGIDTEKVFLFFTRKYIREVRYKWWFHVAPFVSDERRDYVLDPTFVPSPMELNAWTAQFVTNGDKCPVIERYLGHGAHHQDKSCYVRKVSMYYYHPNVLEKADRSNQVVRDWDRAGLRFSEKARPGPK